MDSHRFFFIQAVWSSILQMSPRDNPIRSSEVKKYIPSKEPHKQDPTPRIKKKQKNQSLILLCYTETKYNHIVAKCKFSLSYTGE